MLSYEPFGSVRLSFHQKVRELAFITAKMLFFKNWKRIYIKLLLILIMLVVLRLGHRRKRDARVSTHVGLVSRAFGADGIIFSGEEDQSLLESIRKVCDSWGGNFFARYEKNWKKIIEEFNGIKVHLTMYGIPFEEKINEIKNKRNIMVIVGSEKVPGIVYELADYNLAVTNQPHSEVGALAVFLYSLGRKVKTNGAKLSIIPCEKGKKVEEIKKG
ncbi:MAG: tRNA (cytidine(56)-2'-O)-methyltransferase [archaeon]